MAWYVPTARKNYIINLAMSALVAAAIVLILHISSWTGTIIVFLLLSLMAFRLGEYMLTKKIITGFKLLFGPVYEGDVARTQFIMQLAFFIGFVLLWVLAIRFAGT